MSIVISIKGGVPEFIAGPLSSHIIIVDYDIEGSDESQLVKDQAGNDCLVYCIKQPDDSTAFIIDAEEYFELVHALHGEYGEAWEEYLCRVCRRERNDGGDGYDGMGPSCADLAEIEDCGG